MPRPLNHVEAGESGLCEKLGRGLNEALVRVGNVRAAQGRLDSERKRLVCAYVCGYMRVYATMCVCVYVCVRGLRLRDGERSGAEGKK